jgi:hypothetical protein
METTTSAPPPAAGETGGSLLSGGIAAPPPAPAPPPPTPAPPAPGAPPPPAAPAPGSALIGADGTFQAGWQNSLPESIRGNASLASVPSLAALAENYIATKSLVGKKMQPPAEGAPEAEVAAWRKTVGAPDKPEGYGPLKPDDFPEVAWNKETESKFASIFHKHHLPPAAVREISQLYASTLKEEIGKVEAGENEGRTVEVEKLRKAWGPNFEVEAHAAATMATAFGLDPHHPIFRDAEVVQAFSRGAKMMMGDTLIPGQAAGIAGGIEARLGEIRRSPEYLGQRGESAQKIAQDQLHALLNHGKAA